MYDFEAIASELGFRPDDVKTVLRVFVEDATDTTKQLEIMCMHKAWKQIANEAHAIKGGAGNMKLSALYKLCRSLEEAANAGNEQLVLELLSDLNRCIAGLQQQLRP
jgi:HPt (histidine-containing phosphotransfer) domain-containing protein